MDLYQFYQINFYMYILKYLQHRKTVSQFWVEKTGCLWHVLKKKCFFKRRYNAKKGSLTPFLKAFNAFSKGIITAFLKALYNAFLKDVITPYQMTL